MDFPQQTNMKHLKRICSEILHYLLKMMWNLVIFLRRHTPMQKRSLLTLFSLLVLLIGMVIFPAAAQEEEAPAPALVYDTPEGYELTSSLTNDNLRLESGEETILIFGPDSYSQVLGNETFETDGEELAFFLDRSGFQVGDPLDSLVDGPIAGTRVSLSRRNQQGYAYLMELSAGLRAAVISLHEGRGQVGAPPADVALVLGSIAFPLNVVQVLEYAGNFTTLVAAIDAAGLRETLSGEGPFTVFAPTDDAFTELLGTLNISADELLSSPLLGDILLYHVVAGSVDSTAAAEFIDTSSIPTLLEVNNIFIFTGSSGNLYINNTNVQITQTDLAATNGVVHVVDSVLLPQAAVDAFSGAEATEAP
jgi:uncharacterized surface protein with fasciclin (FAS1) repeats